MTRIRILNILPPPNDMDNNKRGKANIVHTSCAGKGGPTKGPRLTGGVVVQVVCQSMSQPGDRNPPSNQLVEGNVRVEREDMTKECSTKTISNKTKYVI